MRATKRKLFDGVEKMREEITSLKQQLSQAEQKVRDARNEALEEAATIFNTRPPFAVWNEHIVSEIRSLKDKAPQSSPSSADVERLKGVKEFILLHRDKRTKVEHRSCYIGMGDEDWRCEWCTKYDEALAALALFEKGGKVCLNIPGKR